MSKTVEVSKKIGWIRYSISVVLFFLLLSVLAYFTLLLVERPEISNYRKRVEALQSMVMSLQKSYIEISLKGIESDLKLVKKDSLFMSYIEGQVPKESLYHDLGMLMENRSDFDQFRYIDENGMECIRIDNKDGQVIVKDDKDLQDKSSRYYVTETMKLNQGEIYQSAVDLNIENGALEIPYKPMTRMATKVYNALGEEKGLLIINYKIAGLLEDLEEIAKGGEGESYLLNSDSQYISGHPTQNFSFAKEEGSINVVSFKDTDSEEWFHILENMEYNDIFQHYDEGGLITSTKIINGGDHYRYNRWYLVSMLLVDATSIKKESEIPLVVLEDYVGLLPVHLVILLMAWWITNIYYNRKIQNVEMYALAQYDQLTNTYNRNAGLLVIKDNLNYAIKNQYDYTICFIDLNDLKLVNDSFGHEAGDLYLKDSVKLLHEAFRKSDIIVRMGGDEFLVGMHCSAVIAEKNWVKVRGLVKEFNESEVRQFTIALSHGTASAQEEDIENLDELVALADERMYIEKRKMKQGQ